MKYSSDKHIATYIRQLIRDGWNYQRGRRHGRLVSPNGRTVILPCTPSDIRTYQNLRQQVRRVDACAGA